MADDRGYRVQIKFDSEAEDFVAVVAELGLEVHGPTREDVLSGIEEQIEDRIAQIAAEGGALPEASDLVTAAGGELSFELSGPVYRELAYHASLDGISVEEMAKELVAHAVGQLAGRHVPNKSSRGRRGRNDQNDDEDRGNRRDSDDRGNRRDGGRGDDRDQGGGRRGGGRRGRGRREGYQPELDDKANFLDYLRKLEKGGGGGGRGRR
jgi:hypothetical protein